MKEKAAKLAGNRAYGPLKMHIRCPLIKLAKNMDILLCYIFIGSSSAIYRDILAFSPLFGLVTYKIEN
jgi:hypothetical protein